jgi:putative ABC transport system permease protein
MLPIEYLLQELRAHKVRIILAVVAIAWGTFAIALMLSIGEGLRNTFANASLSVRQNVFFARTTQTRTNHLGIPINTPVAFTPEDIAHVNQQVAQLKNTSVIYTFPAKIISPTSVYPIKISAVEPNYVHLRHLILQSNSRFIDKFDMQYARRVVVLSSKLAINLFPKINNRLGRIVYIEHQPYTIIGITKDKLELTGANDQYTAWIPSATYIAFNQPYKISKLLFSTKQAEQIFQAEQSVQQHFAKQYHLDTQDKQIIHVHDFVKLQQKTQQLLFGMEIFLAMIGLLSLIVAGIGIANVMLLAITQNKKNIAVMMAIGAKPKQVLYYYFIEGLLITIVGGVIGITITIIVNHVLQKIIFNNDFLLLIDAPKPMLSMSILLIIFLILSIVSFLSMLFPALKIIKINPARVLKHD